MNSKKRQSQAPATRPEMSRALTSVGLFIILFGSLAPALDVPFLKAGLSWNQIFWPCFVAAALCFISSGVLAVEDFAKMVEAIRRLFGAGGSTA